MRENKNISPNPSGFCARRRNRRIRLSEERPRQRRIHGCAIAYLEEQKTALDGAETIPMDIDWATGRVIRIHADSPYTIDRIISYLTNVTEVCRVEDIPELAYPLVYVGDKISGNNEKLYYSADKKSSSLL